MSTEFIYRAWVDNDGSDVVVRVIAESSNCFPKPTRFEKCFSSVWKTFSVGAVSEMRAFVDQLGKSYAGRCVRESARLTGEAAWKRWASRFRKAGISIGAPPAVVTYGGLPEWISREPATVVAVARGEALEPDLCRLLISHGVRLPVRVVRKGEPVRLTGRCDGALGFMDDDEIMMYAANKRKWGRTVDFELNVVVAMTNAKVVIPPDKDDKIPFHRRALADLPPDAVLLQSPDGRILCQGEFGREFVLCEVASLGQKYEPLPVVFAHADALAAEISLRRDTHDLGWHATSPGRLAVAP